MKLLIPGGAGYIGSHMVKSSQELGYEVVVLDDFSTGHKWAVKDCEIIEVNLLDEDRLSKLLNKRKFDGVIHFAAKSLVGESMQNPGLYYANNVVGSLNLLNQMLKNDNFNIVFSSTAAIFGNPLHKKISEDHPKNPINPYGQSKLMVENIIKDYVKSYGLNAAVLRYFNAAGAHSSGKIGEAHDPETHLIPNIIKSMHNKDTNLKIFGNDYSTSDGTCIRDYVHVCDLADAHVMALKHIKDDNCFLQLNLGNGNGFSVLDIIQSIERVSNEKIKFSIEKRRLGDPDILIADSTKAKSLGWRTNYSEIDDITSSALHWHKNNI